MFRSGSSWIIPDTAVRLCREVVENRSASLVVRKLQTTYARANNNGAAFHQSPPAQESNATRRFRPHTSTSELRECVTYAPPRSKGMAASPGVLRCCTSGPSWLW